MGIYEVVEKLEALRKKRNLVSSLLSLSIVFLIVGMFASSLFDFVLGPFIWFFVLTACMIIFGKILKNITKEYKKLYKENFVVKVLKDKLDDVKYDYERGLEERYVRRFGISKMGNRYESEDYLKASYKGIEFEQADVSISNKNDDTTTVYFKGRMFAFDFPYKSVSSVQIFTKGFPFQGTPMENYNMKKIKMESENFNKLFDVKSANEMEAFYVLTPQMMEKIEIIKQKYNHVGLNFQNNKLFLGIWTVVDTFDGDPKRKINYLGEKEAILKEVEVITDIIDALDLTKDITTDEDSEQNKTITNDDFVSATPQEELLAQLADRGYNIEENALNGKVKFYLKGSPKR